MNKYFATRSVNRPWNIGDTRTAIYCDNNHESIATVHKRLTRRIAQGVSLLCKEDVL